MAALRDRPAGPPTADIRTSGGVGRGSSIKAERVSDALRRLDSPDLTRRRGAIALTLLATAALGLVEAYQTGLLHRVPEPALPGLDADRVDASGEAYSVLSTPDAGLGMASYGVTLVLVGAGTEDRATNQPWLPLLAAGKVAGDAAASLYLFAEQVTQHRKVCSWCTLAALANVASVPLVLPEARRAWQALRHR